MDEFDFRLLSRKQLLKLCSYFSLKLQGAMPNKFTSDDELLGLVCLNLRILNDGTVEPNNNIQNSEYEIRILKGDIIRMIII